MQRLEVGGPSFAVGTARRPVGQEVGGGKKRAGSGLVLRSAMGGFEHQTGLISFMF